MSDDRGSEELAKLQKKLYRRDIEFPERREELSPLAIDPQTKTWHPETDNPTIMPNQQSHKRFPIVRFIFTIAVVFFVGAVGLAAFQYFAGLNVVSGTNIDLSVEGPEKVNAGEVLQLSIAIANRNQKDLEDVKLSVIFPDGTREAEDSTKTLREVREIIGQVASRQVVVKTFKGLVYGEEKQERQVNFVLEYRIVGSNALFKKEESYTFVIGSSPVRVVASLPEEINSGQPLTLDVQASLNTKTPVADLAVVVSYPPGFTFASAEPTPTNGTNVWSLTDLAAGQTKNISIHGTLEGQNDDIKSFRINAGTLALPTDQELAVEYNTLFETIAIRRSFVDLKVLVNNNDDAQVVIDSERVVPIDIEWTNTLPIEIRNGQVEVTVNGEVVNEAAITNRGGNYDSDTNTITWGKNDSSLAVIGPGKTGRVTFGLITKSLLTGSGASLAKPVIDLQVKFTGVRSSGENVSEVVNVEASKTLKVNTVAQLISRGLYNAGAFAPTGPMPPKVGQETLYTIEWTVLNSTNDIKEAQIKAVVPVGLRFVGITSPKDEAVIYNQVDRTVTWNIGNIKAGSATGGGRREVSFQVGLTPSANQVGTSPDLLKNINFSGIDTFTQKVLNINALDINIRLTKDPLFKTTTDSEVVP